MSDRYKWFVPQHLDAPRRIGFLSVPEASTGFIALVLVNELSSLLYALAAAITVVFLLRSMRYRLSSGPGLRPLCYWHLAIGLKTFPPSWKRLLRG